MDRFARQLTNKIISIFFSPGDLGSLGAELPSTGATSYVGTSVQNKNLKITVQLIPKGEQYQPIDVLRLTLALLDKVSDDPTHNFDDLESLINDNPASLAENLSFLEKFFVSCCFLSPYIHFQQNKHLDLDLLRRKFALHFVPQVDPLGPRRKSSGHQKPMPSLENGYEFFRVIENSRSSLAVSMWVANNLEVTVSKVRTIEQLQQQGPKAPPRAKRNRFFSEEISHGDSKDAHLKSGTFVMPKSELKIKHPEEQGSFSKHDTGGRPFKFVNETMVDNLEELSGEDDFTQAAHSEKHNFYSSSLFGEEGAPTQSRNRKESTSRPLGPKEEVSFNDFEDTGTLENLYYMAKKINKFLGGRQGGASEDHSYSSQSVQVVTVPPPREPPATFNKRQFLRFGS